MNYLFLINDFHFAAMKSRISLAPSMEVISPLSYSGRYLDDVEPDNLRRQATDHRPDIPGRDPEGLGRPQAGGIRRVDGIHVQREIDAVAIGQVCVDFLQDGVDAFPADVIGRVKLKLRVVCGRSPTLPSGRSARRW